MKSASLEDRPTPLLRFGPALLKLELFRAPRALPLEPFAATGHQALSRGRQGMPVALRGAVTYEMRKTLEIWNAKAVDAAPAWQPDPSPMARELAEELPPLPLVVAPAADSSALLAALTVLRQKRADARAVALLAADGELPDLPVEAALPDGVERVRITFKEASAARSRVARSLGLLASHASAAAAVYAFDHGGLALITAPGEREFSLEAR
ncbi:MAG TPA: hypothetical protein VGH20_16635 [Myxococcales bacterium]